MSKGHEILSGSIRRAIPVDANPFILRFAKRFEIGTANLQQSPENGSVSRRIASCAQQPLSRRCGHNAISNPVLPVGSLGRQGFQHGERRQAAFAGVGLVQN